MITLLGEVLLAAFIGLAGGIAVGSGMVAFLVVLDMTPACANHAFHSPRYVPMKRPLSWAHFCFTWVDFSDAKIHLFPMGAAFVGLFAGCFVGMLAAALTEIINVLPILAKRVGMGSYMILLLMAMIFGKVFGSLFEWLFY